MKHGRVSTVKELAEWAKRDGIFVERRSTRLIQVWDNKGTTIDCKNFDEAIDAYWEFFEGAQARAGV